MWNSRRYLTLALTALMVIPGAVYAGTRSVAVVCEEPRRPIPELMLVERLEDRLALDNGLTVIRGRSDSAPGVPDQQFDVERLAQWGQTIEARYIVYLRIDMREVVTRKQLSIPLVLSRYVVEGQVQGTYSLIDVGKSKLVKTWDLKAALTGKRQWQAFDDFREDPDLQLSATQKMTLIGRLEDKAATQIIETIKPHLRGK
jgi:hypothetical protein